MRGLYILGRNNFLRFQSNASGNVAIMVAVLFIPLVIAVAGAVDITHFASIENRLRAATESAALAAASLRSSSDLEKTSKEYVKSNLPDTDLWRTVDIQVPAPEVTTNSRTITVNASIALPTSFLKIIGIDKLTAHASSVATQTKSDAEIALVLDISSSMDRSGKIDKLIPAAKDFVDAIFDDELFQEASVSLIPFGGTVNVGSELFEKWVINERDQEKDPGPRQYQVGSSIPSEKFRFTDGGNCIEYRPEDASEDLIPLESRPQLPDFWKWNDGNPWCPPDSTAMLLNSSNPTKIKNRIDDMELSDGTGMDIGAIWGLKALSPKWRGQLGGDNSDRPANFNDAKTLKFMILMTDGDITAQYRPIDYRKGDTKGSRNQQTMLPKGWTSTSPNTNSAYGYFKRVCNDLRTNGVTVFTIGFKIPANGNAEEMLQYCATNIGNYYLVDNLDIGSAFDSIHRAISQLRIKG